MSTSNKNQSRMFRTIVVMGSGLAISCGGKAGVDGQTAAGGGGAASAGGASGVSGGGSVNGGSSSAGSLNLGGYTGGSFGVGGSYGGALSIGGSPAGGTSAVGGSGAAPNCPPAEWTCSGPEGCSYDTGWTPNSCKCDPSHPKTSADCKPGQAFTCLRTGSVAAKDVHGYDCQCVPANSNCGAQCAAAFPNLLRGDVSCDTETVPNTVLCGCAIVLLK